MSAPKEDEGQLTGERYSPSCLAAWFVQINVHIGQVEEVDLVIESVVRSNTVEKQSRERSEHKNLK